MELHPSYHSLTNSTKLKVERKPNPFRYVWAKSTKSTSMNSFSCFWFAHILYLYLQTIQPYTTIVSLVFPYIFMWSKVVVPKSLLHDLLPGPVTLVFERSSNLPSTVNPATCLVGFRIPNNDFIREICRNCKAPLALTSANISDAMSSLNVEEFRELLPRLDCVFDGGQLAETELSRKGSTVVDLSVENSFKILRPGSALHSTVKILMSSKYNLIERS